MKYRAKVDANQKTIVKDLRDLGCTVALLHAVGKGVPDLLVGRDGKNWLLEVKNLKGRGRKLTDPQVEWHKVWRGSVLTVTSTEDAVRQMCIPVVGQ